MQWYEGLNDTDHHVGFVAAVHESRHCKVWMRFVYHPGKDILFIDHHGKDILSIYHPGKDILFIYHPGHILNENIYFAWSKTSYKGDKWRGHRFNTDG